MNAAFGTQRRPAPAARIRTILAFALAAALPVIGQPAPSAPGPAPESPASAPSSGLPRGFREIELGMGRDEVIEALKRDPLYSYRGPEDVTLLPSPNQSLIDVSGLSFVRRGFFQFYDGKLWVIILVMNEDKIDHYSLYTSLSSKYGEPGLLDPKEARWEDGQTRVALERPLTLRYMDLPAFDELAGKSSVEQTVVDLERAEFLGGL